MERLVLAHTRAPGDVIAMTALVRDLARAHPGRYQVAVDTPYRDIWAANPHVVPRDPKAGGRFLSLSYGKAIARAGRECIHFLTAWHDNFAEQTGVRVPLLLPKPDLHLTEAERAARLVTGRYWVLVAGGKNDFTTKHYVYARHQRVVDALRGYGIPVVQAGAADRGHRHPAMAGALNLVGKTTLREFMRLIAQADGVICTITSAMHIAAAFDRPCVVTAGGREEWWWEGYTNTGDQFGPVASRRVAVPHRYLHTQGLLDCCKFKGCWRNKTLPSEEDSRKSYCHLPVLSEGNQAVPKCQDMISAEMVVQAVLSYYLDGTLPPTPEGPGMLPISQDGLTFPDAQGRQIRLRVETVNGPAHSPLTLPQLSPISPPPFPPPSPAVVVKPLGVVAAPPALARPTEGGRPTVAPPAEVKAVYDHPRVGGKFTVCVLLYGDFYDMHRRCLEAILASCPPERIDLRVGSNELGPRSFDYVQGLGNEGRVHLHYAHRNNAKKYPVMREMFWDPSAPLTTDWVVWFDDDSMCDKNKDWLALLSQQVVNYPDADMFGPVRFYKLAPAQAAWVRAAPWYRGRPFRDKAGKPAPNGDKVHFAVGAFWALRAATLRAADVPCKRLAHNGGDWTIGEQLYQAGAKLKNWTGGKEVVNWSSVPRRGLSEKHPGQ